MALYQRKLLADMSDIGEPGPLPRFLIGLTDDVLADVSAKLDARACEELGVTGHGFFPVAEEPAPAPRPRWVHKAIYLRRFTAAERIAIQAARGGDPILNDLLYVLESAENIFLDDPDLAQGLGYLVQQGHLAARRPAEILA